MRHLIVTVFAVVALGLVPWTADAQQGSGSVAVEQPWARASIGTTRPAAAYLTLVNNGGGIVRLASIESPVAGRAEVHRTVKQGEVMRMEPAGTIELPAGGRVVLEPGGLHIMLMDLKQPLKKGESFPLMLRFADGPTVEVTVPIMGPGARGPNQ